MPQEELAKGQGRLCALLQDDPKTPGCERERVSQALFPQLGGHALREADIKVPQELAEDLAHFQERERPSRAVVRT
jgi:hypothetical protein